jgi:hypothetical protein
MLFELIAYDSFLFWVFGAVVLGSFCVFTYQESLLKTLLLVIGTVGIIILFSNIPIISWFDSLHLNMLVDIF